MEKYKFRVLEQKILRSILKILIYLSMFLFSTVPSNCAYFPTDSVRACSVITDNLVCSGHSKYFKNKPADSFTSANKCKGGKWGPCILKECIYEKRKSNSGSIPNNPLYNNDPWSGPRKSGTYEAYKPPNMM